MIEAIRLSRSGVGTGGRTAARARVREARRRRWALGAGMRATSAGGSPSTGSAVARVATPVHAGARDRRKKGGSSSRLLPMCFRSHAS